MALNPDILAIAQDALRVPDDDCAVLDQYLEAAEAAVLRYVDWDAEAYDEASATDKKLVDNAIVLLTGHYYRSPDVDDAEAFGHGQLPWMVTAALHQIRTPTLA